MFYNCSVKQIQIPFRTKMGKTPQSKRSVHSDAETTAKFCKKRIQDDELFAKEGRKHLNKDETLEKKLNSMFKHTVMHSYMHIVHAIIMMELHMS